jgi:hypothetical protein
MVKSLTLASENLMEQTFEKRCFEIYNKFVCACCHFGGFCRFFPQKVETSDIMRTAYHLITHDSRSAMLRPFPICIFICIIKFIIKLKKTVDLRTRRLHCRHFLFFTNHKSLRKLTETRIMMAATTNTVQGCMHHQTGITGLLSVYAIGTRHGNGLSNALRLCRRTARRLCWQLCLSRVHLTRQKICI